MVQRCAKKRELAPVAERVMRQQQYVYCGLHGMPHQAAAAQCTVEALRSCHRSLPWALAAMQAAGSLLHCLQSVE
jgi:hypothetical protein